MRNTTKTAYPICIGDYWFHEQGDLLCKVTDILVDSDGEVIIMTESYDEFEEPDSDNIKDFLREYKFVKGKRQ